MSRLELGLEEVLVVDSNSENRVRVRARVRVRVRYVTRGWGTLLPP